MKKTSGIVLAFLMLFGCMAAISYAVEESEYTWTYDGDYETATPGYPTKDQAIKALYASTEAQKQLKELNIPLKNFFAIIVYTIGKGRVNATALQPHDICTYLLYVHFPKKPDGTHLWAPAEVVFTRDVSGSKPGPWVVQSVEYSFSQNEYPHTINERDVDITEMRLRSE